MSWQDNKKILMGKSTQTVHLNFSHADFDVYYKKVVLISVPQNANYDNSRIVNMQAAAVGLYTIVFDNE